MYIVWVQPFLYVVNIRMDSKMVFKGSLCSLILFSIWFSREAYAL